MISGIVLAIGGGIIGIACLFSGHFKGVCYCFLIIVLGYFLNYDLPRLLNRPDMLPNQPTATIEE